MPGPPDHTQRSSSGVGRTVLVVLILGVAGWMHSQRSTSPAPAEARTTPPPEAMPADLPGFRPDAWFFPGRGPARLRGDSRRALPGWGVTRRPTRRPSRTSGGRERPRKARWTCRPSTSAASRSPSPSSRRSSTRPGSASAHRRFRPRRTTRSRPSRGRIRSPIVAGSMRHCAHRPTFRRSWAVCSATAGRSHCRPRRNGKRRRGEQTGGSIRGEARRAGTGRTTRDQARRRSAATPAPTAPTACST